MLVSKLTLALVIALAASLGAIAVLVAVVLSAGNREEAALQAGSATPEETHTPVPTPTPTPTPSATVTPTELPPSPTATLAPTGTPTQVPPQVALQPPPTAKPERQCADTVRYYTDLTFLNTLLQTLSQRLGMATGFGYYPVPPAGSPCPSTCDRQWLDTAIAWAERGLEHGFPFGTVPMVPRNLCPR